MSEPYDRNLLKDSIIALPQTATMSSDGYIPVITIIAGQLFVRRITPADFRSVVAGGVTSVFGRQGNVVAQAGDYDLTAITGLMAALAGKSDVGHGHAIGDVSGLTAALAAKADLVLVRPDAITPPANLTGQSQNVLVESADFTFTNADQTGVYPVAVRGAAGNPEIRANGGAWSQHINIRHGDVLRLRITTAGTAATQRQATIYTPGRNFTWGATTT